MPVGVDGGRERGRAEGAARETRVQRAFGATPAVVPTTRSACELEVDFLSRVLTDVADPQVACFTIERVAPRITETVRPDRVVGRHATRERIARRNGVVRTRAANRWLDAVHLAKTRRQVLRGVVRVVCATTVTDGDVEVAVWAEVDPTTVVVGERIAPSHQNDARRVRDVRIRGRTGVARDVVCSGVRVVDVELSVLRVVRVKREAEEAAFIADA